MDRVVASLPESTEELCLIRVGLVIRKVQAYMFAMKMGRAIDLSGLQARLSGAGLLRSERFRFNWNHFGVLQYWSSFEALEEWSHRPPHSDWWRDALERMRKKKDFGIYHETFLVPPGGIESIYLNSPVIGLAAFGETGEAIRAMTTSRGRLKRRMRG